MSICKGRERWKSKTVQRWWIVIIYSNWLKRAAINKQSTTPPEKFPLLSRRRRRRESRVWCKGMRICGMREWRMRPVQKRTGYWIRESTQRAVERRLLLRKRALPDLNGAYYSLRGERSAFALRLLPFFSLYYLIYFLYFSTRGKSRA